MAKKDKVREHEESLRKHAMFLDERKLLLGKKSTNIQEFDRAMITVSTFSLGYVLSQADKYDNTIIFVVHSAIFLLCVVFTMVSCMLGNRSIDKQLKINEDYYLNDKEDAINEVPCEEGIVLWLGNITWILFLIGLGLAIFVSVQMKGVSNG